MITKLTEIEHKMPIQGRIRLGTKHPQKGYPMSLETFRFTSQHQDAITELSVLYGGDVKPWNKQWEVITEVSTVPVILPLNPLGDTPQYELWSGGGRMRTCDGETCIVPAKTPDGMELEDRPCICDKQNVLECSVQTRLLVVLREIKFGGAWMLSSTGWNAAKELPGMVAMVQGVQGMGLTTAKLALEKRQSKQPGQGVKNFVVPVLQPDVSLDALAQGQGSIGYYATKELEEG